MNDNIRMIRGNTLSFGLEFEGLDQNLYGAYFTCRKSELSPILFQKTLGDGITKLDRNHYIVRVAPEDTRYLDTGSYEYDLEIRVNDDRFTPLRGILELVSNITR